MMDEATIALQRAALALGVKARVELTDLLLGSFDEVDPVVDQLWLEEARLRMESYRAGTIKALDADEFFRGMQDS